MLVVFLRLDELLLFVVFLFVVLPPDVLLRLDDDADFLVFLLSSFAIKTSDKTILTALG